MVAGDWWFALFAAAIMGAQVLRSPGAAEAPARGRGRGEDGACAWQERPRPGNDPHGLIE
jgi:hypothetical protein